MEYLLAAEADRIQDLLFRSSQLREVVGGSQLLSRFCEHEDVKRDEDKGILHLLSDRLGVMPEVVTSGGGSFRITFQTENEACRFGAALAEAYYRATGGRLSVAEPVAIADGSKQAWEEASETAGKRLRRAKRGGPPVATHHIPYISFCESCGVGLAETHESRFPDEEGHYLCPACIDKATERAKKSKEGFLKKFYDQVSGTSALNWPEDADDVAQYDPRGYVAYIVADGDGMGRVFGGCDKDQSAMLSRGMDDALREALAEPTRRFMKNDAANQNPHLVPVLPLILGGDDLFALVPARWGLDFALRLCRTFQHAMTQWAHDHGIPHEITMSAAVVICKANYPYYLAHQIGEERLSETKRAVKALAAEGLRLSAVDFEVVLGSQAAPRRQADKWRPTLCPYWVTSETQKKVPDEWGLALDKLLDWRHRLVGTPSRRRSQLREHFDQVPPDGCADRWDERLQRILARIERDWTRKDEEQHPVLKSLEELGGLKLDDWHALDRRSDESSWHGHAMPDLLRAWDWTWDLDYPPIAYEGGER